MLIWEPLPAKIHLVQPRLKASSDPKAAKMRLEHCKELLVKVAQDTDGMEHRTEMRHHAGNAKHCDAFWGVLPKVFAKAITCICVEADSHVYIYFESESDLQKALEHYPRLMHHLRICHALHDCNEALEGAFLSREDSEAALRSYLHLKVLYANGDDGDLYFLRGEISHERQREVRQRLAPFEKLCQKSHLIPPGVVPVGLFPSHSTGAGEGYPWIHFHEYAQYAKESARRACEGGGMGDKVVWNSDVEVPVDSSNGEQKPRDVQVLSV